MVDIQEIDLEQSKAVRKRTWTIYVGYALIFIIIMGMVTVKNIQYDEQAQSQAARVFPMDYAELIDCDESYYYYEIEVSEYRYGQLMDYIADNGGEVMTEHDIALWTDVVFRMPMS